MSKKIVSFILVGVLVVGMIPIGLWAGGVFDKDDPLAAAIKTFKNAKYIPAIDEVIPGAALASHTDDAQRMSAHYDGQDANKIQDVLEDFKYLAETIEQQIEWLGLNNPHKHYRVATRLGVWARQEITYRNPGDPQLRCQIDEQRIVVNRRGDTICWRFMKNGEVINGVKQYRWFYRSRVTVFADGSTELYYGAYHENGYSGLYSLYTKDRYVFYGAGLWDTGRDARYYEFAETDGIKNGRHVYLDFAESGILSENIKTWIFGGDEDNMFLYENRNGAFSLYLTDDMDELHQTIYADVLNNFKIDTIDDILVVNSDNIGVWLEKVYDYVKSKERGFLS